MNSVTIQVIDGKIKLVSDSGFLTELSEHQLQSLSFDIWCAQMELAGQEVV